VAVPQDTSQLDPKVVKVMSAIKKIESGGDYNAVGDLDKGVSRGAYQFNRDNFKSWAGEHGLDPNDFSPANQNKVAYARIKKLKDEGRQPEEIAAIWNGARKTPEGTYTYIDPKYGEKFRAALGASASAQSSGLGGNYAPPPEVKSYESVSQETQGAKEKPFLQKAAEFVFPILEEKERTPLQTVGDVGLSVLPFVPGLGQAGLAAKAGGTVAKSVVPKVLTGSIAKNAGLGYGAGVASKLSEGSSVPEALAPSLETVGGAIVGGGTAGLLNRFGGGAQGLKQSAAKDIESVLSPTTKQNKITTQKITERLSKESPIAMSRGALLEKYEDKLGKIGEELTQAYDELPADAQFEVSGLLGTLNQKIDDLTINGVVPSAAKAKVDAYQDMMKDLVQAGIRVSDDGSQVFSDVANIRRLRQILDKGKRSFSFTDFDSARQEAQKTLANSIRSEFGKQYPDIAKINKEFNFWSNATEVLQAAIDRKTGQSGLIRKGIAAGIGMGAGSPAGQPLLGAILMKSLSDFIDSPGFNLVSARIKSQIADAIGKGNYGVASQLIQTAMKTAPVAGALGIQGLISPTMSESTPQIGGL